MIAKGTVAEISEVGWKETRVSSHKFSTGVNKKMTNP